MSSYELTTKQDMIEKIRFARDALAAYLKDECFVMAGQIIEYPVEYALAELDDVLGG